MRFRGVVACLSFVFSMVSGAIAQNNSIPTVPENSPYLDYIHGAVADGSYNASMQVFSLSGSPSAFYLPRQTGFCNPITTPSCPTPALSLAIQVDNNGNLIGGNPTAGQPDFELIGQITSGGVTYTSPLLTGTVTQFFYDGVNDTPNFAFRIAVTGGSMASLYVNPPSMDNDLWMTLNLEGVSGSPNFSGSFATSWGGEIKGNVYSTPGQCFGTIGDFVWNDLNGNGIQDAGEPGLNGVTVDLYDYQGNLLQSVVTQQGPTGSQLGYYQFTGVCAGTYTVKVDTTTLPKGANGQIDFAPTTPNAPGSTTANDSNPNPSPVTLSTNDSVNETIDFGFVSFQGAIGDYVWYDANRNGLQDAGESGINGVTVDLYDSTQTDLLGTTTTAFGGPNNVNGYYQFTGLSAGSYVVVVDSSTLPANYVPTTSFVGSNPAIDSNGSPAAVNLPTDSSTDETIDFGYVTACTGVIGDFVWHDLNQNGIQDAGEPGISGVTLDLYDSTHTLIQTATTNGSGYYQFSGLCAGSYEVDVVGSTLPPNFTPTASEAPGSTTANDSNGSPAPVVLTTDSNNNVVSDLTIDFGYVSPCNGAVGDFVWSDLNGNGIQDAGEPGIANVSVSLFDSQNHLLNSTTTNQNGYYQFTGLCAATYIVQVTPPAGYLSTIPNAPGSTPANDSNPSPSTVVLTITDSNGDISTDETIDFGFVLPPSASCVSINAVEGSAITPVTMVGSGGLGGPYTFTATGLPAGLSISSAGVISGTATESGMFNYTVTVTDSAGNTGTVNCSITVAPPVSATCVAISAVQGIAITPVTMVGSGGLGGPYSFTATGLPAGLSISSAGVISGTPTVSGTFNYTVTVTDSAGNTGTVNCSITVAPPVSATCVAISAVQGIAITPVTMVGSGGLGGPYSFTATGLPAGLSISSAGVISGTATVSGTFNYTVTVTDSKGNTGTVNCSVTVAPPVSATCVAINAVQGIAITPVTMVGSGGLGAPYTFTATGLPAGLNISSAGVISGTATVSGTFNYTVTVTDNAGNTGTVNCSVTVAPPVSATCVAINAVQGIAITPVTMVGSGGLGGPYTFTATGLPGGLSISSVGVISGTPTVSGTFNYTVMVTDNAGNTGTVNCSVTVAPPVSATCVAINAVQGIAITPVAMVGSGGLGGPYTFTATGLPAGLSISSAGVISGTPTVSGTFNYTVTVTDSKGNTGTVNCSVTVAPPVSATCVAINAVQGIAITPVTMVGSGGLGGPYTFTATSLPAGLNISSAGVISGTATVSGTFNYTVTVTDSKGNTGTVNCSVTVAPPVSATCVAINAVQGIAITPVTMVGSGGLGGPYTFTATGLPGGLSISSAGVISGTPTVSGTFNYTVTVTDSKGNTGTVNCSVTVAPPVSATCVAINAVQGIAITPVTMVGSGGLGGPYTFTATGLPGGLSISSAGVISGTPTVSGTFNYTVTVTDSKGNTGTVNCSIAVNPPPSPLCGGDAATIGFWHNKNGQALIEGVNGGPTATNLANWLATNFPYLYGVNSGNNLTGKTNADVASLFMTFFNESGTPTNAQVMAGALAIYVTNSTLAGSNIAASYGFNVSSTGTGAKTYNVGSNGAAIGLADNTSYTILQLMQQANSQMKLGTFDANAFNTIFNGINNAENCTVTPAVSATCLSIDAVQGDAIVAATLVGSGGTGPYTFTATGLPAGLSLSSSGTISGTPTVSGTFNYTVTITDSKGNKGTLNCSITVLPPVSVSCVTFNAIEGVAITPVALTGSGGAGGSYTYTATGLPPGLTMSSSGVISGTPTASGTYNYTVTVTDTGGNMSSGRCSHQGTLSCSITVAPAVSATCLSIDAVQGDAIVAATLVGSGGTGPYTFTETGLPAGLSLSSSGTISGTPTVSGTFNYTVTITDSKGSKGTLNCSITVLPPVSVSCVTFDAVQGVAITPVSLTGSGGAGGSYTYTATGLPPGLTMSSSGVISGTPTASGTFNYTVTVTDTGGNMSSGRCSHQGTLSCSITVVPPVSGKCGSFNPVQGSSITPVKCQGSGGTGSGYTYKCNGLPPGMKMSSSGNIYGTPTASGTYHCTVTITDSAGHAGTVNCSVSVSSRGH